MWDLADVQAFVAAFTAHHGFDASQGGMEYPLTLAFAVAAHLEPEILVVDEVLGQRQFDEDERFTWDAANDDALDSTPYSAEGFRRDEETWRVFKLGQLTTQSRFMQVAV